MRPERIRGNLFVANLPIGLTDEQLAELVDEYGIVLGAYLARDPDGATLGHGLVQLAPDRAVEAASLALSALEIGGRRIEARRADPTMSLNPPRRPRPPRPTGQLGFSVEERRLSGPTRIGGSRTQFLAPRRELAR